MATGLKHQHSQIRNRINQLKTLHTFWKACNKDTGLGRHADGTIIASDGWWKSNTKGKFSECKKFRYGVPHYIDHLEEMFRDVVVDGSTSFVAGCEEDEDQDVDDVEEDDQYGTEGDVNAYEDSPMSYNTKKRGSTPSTKSTATSPSKKSKSPLLKMVSSLVDKLTTSDKDDGLLRSVGESIATSLNEKRQKLNPIKEMGESVKRCQQLALECGAAPESVEFYACRHLFKDPYEREFFCNIPTPEGRLRYLQRVCKENNLYE
nr:uncharacterized protein LOC117846151 [Setaria viridis]